MEPLKIVNLYVETDLHGPRRQDGTAIYVLEAQTSKGAATRHKIVPIPATTEHHLVLEALEDALGRLTQCSGGGMADGPLHIGCHKQWPTAAVAAPGLAVC